MLYSFLSESGVLDISLLALSTGIIVLSILGLLHLGKRRGHNKAGHFSEQPDDCAMPAVQTEIAMDGPRWNNLRQLNLYPLSLHLKILQISILRLPKRSYPKAGCEAGVCSRTGHTMATFDDIARLQKTFLVRVDYDLRASLYVSAPTKRKILEVLKKSAASD